MRDGGRNSCRDDGEAVAAPAFAGTWAQQARPPPQGKCFFLLLLGLPSAVLIFLVGKYNDPFFYLQSHASTSDAPPVTENVIPVVDNDLGACSSPSTSGLYIVLSVVWMLSRSHNSFMSCDQMWSDGINTRFRNRVHIGHYILFYMIDTIWL
jgi:hypothetical protein